MPTATDLHIQSRAEGTPRVLPLSASAVRVGRGEQCEVRLDDADLAEVQCLLRRRGETWHVQPIGPPGALSVEGRVVESPRTLALGVALRVGDHWLTLRPAGTEPPPALGSFEAPIIVPFRATEPARLDPVAARPSLYRPAAERDPIPRRAATLAQPPRARSTTVPPSRPIPRSVPPRPPVADRPPIAPRAPTAPRAEIPTPATPSPTVDRRRLAAGSLLSRMFDLIEPPARPAAEARRASAPPAEVAPLAEPEPAVIVVEVLPVVEPERAVVEIITVEEAEPKVVEVVAFVEPELVVEVATGPIIVEVIPVVEPEAVEVDEPTASVPTALVLPADADLLAWPSASRIIGEGARGPRRTGPRVGRAMPAPSASIAPASWSLQRWAAIGPSAIVLLAVGAVGVGLSMVWAEDDRLAGVLADALSNARALPTGPMAASLPADAAWWGSTGPHLRLRAVAASRLKADPGAEELSRFYLNASRVASPLDAAVRLDSSRRDGAASPPSRDPLALAWRGRQLREAGKLDEADASLRDAFALAETSDEGPGPTSFDESSGVRRYTLPGEALVVAILETGWGATPPSAESLPRSPLVLLAAHRWLRDRRLPGADRPLDLAAGSPAETPLDRLARAEAMALRGEQAEARSAYREVLDASPGAPWARVAWYNAGALAARAEDSAAARTCWDHARGDNPADPISRRVADAMAARAANASRNPINGR